MTIKSNLRRIIRKFHFGIDGWIGRNIFGESTLLDLSENPHHPLLPSDFAKYGYSKISHFKKFLVHPHHRQQTPASCDLKIYQDSLIYTFIKDNFLPGARFLEIGGGESRVIDALKADFEIWNLDKIEGKGFGPKELHVTKGFKFVKDYIGTFSSQLPEESFELIFSISTLEHLPLDYQKNLDVLEDMDRLLKTRGFSIHCIDGLLHSDRYEVHPIVEMIFQREQVQVPQFTYQNLINDGDLWLLSPYAFYSRWYPFVRKTMRSFGIPFSINLLWQKK